MKPNWNLILSHPSGHTMPSITLKNIPENLYLALKQSAGDHHRSINSQILVCLEQSLIVNTISPEDRLENIRAMRSRLGKKKITPAEIRKAIASGRP